MRRLVAIGVAALALAPGARAVPPPTPTDVYADFAAHGRLTHVYPRSLLESIINDASLNQYGDPLVMLRLRRAARLQLAGVLPRTTTPPPATTTAPTATTRPTTGTTTTTTTRPGKTGATSTTPRTRRHSSPTTPAPTTPRPVPAAAGTAPLLSTRAIVLFVLAFVAAVAALGAASLRARRG